MKKHQGSSKGQRKHRRVARPRKPKTFEDVTTLTGTEYYQTDEGITFRWADLAEDQMIYLGELLTKFYQINEGLKPVAFELVEDKAQSIPEKTWYCVMRGGFYVRIIGNTSAGGPHQTQLWFKSFTPTATAGDIPTRKTYWIASLQLESFFYNEEQTLAALQLAITNREFYMPPNQREAAIIP